MTLSRRELRQRANEEAARRAAEAGRVSDSDAASADEPVPDAQPLPAQPTRRELRQMRVLQETGEIPVVREDPAPTAPGLAAEIRTGEGSTQTPPALHASEPETTRPARRRRPVLPPQASGSSPVIDPATGAIAAITINIPAESESERESVPGDATEGAGDDEAVGQPSSAPDTTPHPRTDAAPAPESVPQLPAEPVLPPPPPASHHEIDFDSIISGVVDDAPPAPTVLETPDEPSTPKRASLFDKLNDEPNADLDRSTEPTEPDDEPEQLLTVEQAAIQSHASPAVTFLRYLVLVIAMFVIGGLLWLIADRAVATELGTAILETTTQGGVGT